MPNLIDDNGLDIVGYQDLRAEKVEQYKTEFGDDIKTTVDSVFGQQISISTQNENNLISLISTLLTTFDPNAANGEILSRLAVIMNKRRNEAVKSSVVVDVTTDANGATIPIGFIVSNSSNIEFITTTSLIIAPSTTAQMTFTAVSDGAIVASSGTLSVIKTPVFGVGSTNNPDDAVVGRDRESDAELRGRMLRTSSNSNGTLSGIFTALSEVDGVTFVNVIENNTNVVFANGQKAHTVFPIIENGSDDEIAQALITKGAAGGIGYVEQGDIAGVTISSATFIDPISSQIYTAHWARPVDKRVYCDIQVKKLADYPANGSDLIKTAVNEWVTKYGEVGTTFYASFIYDAINSIGGLAIETVFVGDTISPVTTFVAMGDVEKPNIAEIDIVVVEVV